MATIKASESSTTKAQDEPAEPPDLTGLEHFLQALNARSIPLTGIFLLLLLFALKFASAFFIPLFLALLLKFLFASVIRWLNRWSIPSGAGAALIIVFLLGSVGTVIYELAPPARDWMTKLPRTVQLIEVKLADFKRSMRQISQATKAVDRLTNLDGEKTPKVQVSKSALGESLVAPMHDFLVGAGIVVILLFFLLASGDMFLRKTVAVLPRFSDKKKAVEITHQIEHDISTYLMVITLINALFGTAVGSAMYFLGLPNPFLWGVMAGLLHFIPFLGAIVGITVVTLVALISLDNLSIVLLAPLLYLSLNLLEEYVLLPVVLGRRLLLNPVVLLVWLIFWGWLWGIPGALMAVPSLAIVKIISEHVDSLRALDELIAR